MVRRRQAALPALALAAAVSVPPDAAAQQGPSADAAREARVEEIFAPWSGGRTPGCAVGVARLGELVLARGFGLANLEHGIPIAADTVLPIGSNSKQFGAALAALLAAEGVLDLDADLRRYLPELPDYGRPLTVRNLVHHTGGLRDYQALRMLAGVPPDHLDAQQVLGLLLRQRGLDFPPGERFEYDNSGYVLLRFALERAAGRPLPELARERLFAPLGMTATRWLEADHAVVVPKRATPYAGNAADGYLARPGSSAMASGGIVTTLGDLARWHAFLLGVRTGELPADLPLRLLEPGRLASGETIDYAWGLFLDEHAGHRLAWHAGTGPGFVADTALYPDAGLSVFCLCNGVIDSRALARRVAELYLEERAGSAGDAVPMSDPRDEEGASASPTAVESNEAVPLALTAELLSALTGRYRDPESGSIWELSPGDGALVVRGGRFRFGFRPQGGVLVTREPGWESWRLRIERPDAGEVRVLRLFDGDRETARYERLPDSPPADRLLAYTGRFASEELGADYTLAAEGGRLALHTPVQPNGTLEYLGGEAFVLPTEWFEVRFDFTRGERGEVDGFAVSTGEANGIVFRRAARCDAALTPTR